MWEMILPIGSVCRIQDNQIVMIIGYFPVSIEKDDYVYDYVAEKYPEGTLTNHQSIYFNRQDVKEILYKGYMDDSCTKFIEQVKKMSMMLKKMKNDQADKNFTADQEKSTNSISNLYQFDESGRVIVEETPNSKEAQPEIVDMNIEEKSQNQMNIDVSSEAYQFDKDGKVLMEATTKLVSKPMPLYQFDENGVVVADHLDEEKRELPKLENVSNPFTLNETRENSKVEKDTKKWPIFKSIKFDENGVVVATEEY